MINNTKAKRLLWVFFLFMLLAFLSSFFLGRYPVDPKELTGLPQKVWLSLVYGLKPSLNTAETVIMNIRFPRVMAALLVGTCLSAAGAAYQGVFQNPMASPDVLGATAGAAFGAALAILYNQSQIKIVLSAFIFSLGTVFLVWIIGSRTKGNRILGLILAGIMVSSLFSAATSFIKLVADPLDQLPAITYWLIGSLSGVKRAQLTFVLPFMIFGLVILLLLRWRLNILTLGDEQARSLGINPQRMRLLTILASTLLTASSIAISGVVGWIGLVIPHLSRRIIGSDYRYLMPLSMIFGGAFLLVVDNISRNLLRTEIPIGILTALVGAPFFLFLITAKEGNI